MSCSQTCPANVYLACRNADAVAFRQMFIAGQVWEHHNYYLVQQRMHMLHQSTPSRSIITTPISIRTTIVQTLSNDVLIWNARGRCLFSYGTPVFKYINSCLGVAFILRSTILTYIHAAYNYDRISLISRIESSGQY